jgi:CheY-like chemotaxis protein
VPGASARILVVEDDLPNLRLITLLLEQEGYQVSTAATLDQATAVLTCTTFDLVLADSFSHTPDGVLAGTAVIRQAAGNIPIMLLTAHPVDPISARAAGFAAAIGMPYDIDELLRQVREVLPSISVSYRPVTLDHAIKGGGR